MRGIIISDNIFDWPRSIIGRANGAYRIAGLLRENGFDVEVLDFFNNWSIDELKQFLLHYPIDFLGISFGLAYLNNTSLQPTKFIQLAREMYPNIKVIAGGSTVLFNKADGIDLHFKGFADGAIEDIVNYLKEGVYPNNSIEFKTLDQVKNIIDCNHYYKDFDLSRLHTKYTKNDFISRHENLTLEVSRGCVFKCKFCNFPLIGKKKNDYIRLKEDLKEEIIYNYENYGVSQYSITDDTFNDNEYKIDILYEISQEVDFDLKFMCFARVDLIHAKPHTLEKMMASGIKAMFFGIESLKPESSKIIGKSFTGDRCIEYLRVIKDKYPNLHITGSFIIGLPHESEEEAERNIDFLVENGLVDAVPVFGLHIPRHADGVDISYFSKHWQELGYSELSVEEINELLKEDKYQEFRNQDFNELTKTSIFWKNDQMNVFDATISAKNIRLKLENSTTMGGWGCFSATFVGTHDLDYFLKLRKSEWVEFDTVGQATKFIDDYKINKLKSITNTI
jgi:radical SAM superfamily enzyme YgiQ (UPF0313 family)